MPIFLCLQCNKGNELPAYNPMFATTSVLILPIMCRSIKVST
jgi:hypothetical protein